MYPTAKLLLLLEAVLHIAHHGERQPIGGKRLAEILQLPPRFLEPLLQELVKAHILHSVRGPKGGYYLARDKKAITVADIVQAIQEAEAKEDMSSLLQQKILRPVFDAAYQEYMTHLATYSLHTLFTLINEKKLHTVFGASEEATLHYAI